MEDQNETLRFQPFTDQVLVRRFEESTQKKTGPFVDPESSKDKPQEGTVLFVGPDVESATPGQHIFFSKFSGKPITLHGVDYVIMHESEILGALAQVFVDQTTGETVTL